MGKKEKKLGSVANIKEDKPNDKKSIWDYKLYIIIAVIAIVVAIIYFFTIRNMSRNQGFSGATPIASSSPSPNPNVGRLEVTTDPTETVIQFNSQVKRAPTAFENVPEGKFIVILSLPGYKTIERKVIIEKSKTTKLDVKMEK
jgi:hypothetical protein